MGLTVSIPDKRYVFLLVHYVIKGCGIREHQIVAFKDFLASQEIHDVPSQVNINVRQFLTAHFVSPSILASPQKEERALGISEAGNYKQPFSVKELKDYLFNSKAFILLNRKLDPRLST